MLLTFIYALMRSLGNFTAGELYEAGYSVIDLKVAGYTVEELRKGGYPKGSLEAAGMY